MDKSEASDGGSSPNHKKMAGASGHEQSAILKEVYMYMEAIQKLVKGQDAGKNVQQAHNDIVDASLAAISCHIEKIRKIITEGIPSSPSTQNMTNQADNASVDVTAVSEKALNNSVVLRTIMSYLDADELLDMRLVSKKWEEEATIQLLSQELYRVIFTWDEKTLKFRNDIGSLEEFTENCSRDPVRKFPCSEFHFSFTRVLNTESADPPADLSDFLSKYGHHIKGLCLQSVSNSAALKKLKKIIFEWTPGLQSLTLDLPFYTRYVGHPIPPEDPIEPEPDNSPPTPSLDNLQELNLTDWYPSQSMVVLERCKKFVSLILSSAPNLQRITDPHLFFTPEIMASGKVRAVDFIHLSGISFLMPGFPEFSSARPLLTYLELDLELFLHEAPISLSGYASSLELILESCKVSLKTLHLIGRIHLDFALGFGTGMVQEQLPRIHVPVMENLEKLKLHKWSEFSGGEGRILPEGSSVQSAFPRLKYLAVKGIRNDEDDNQGTVDHPFSSHLNSSSTVEKLTITPALGNSFDPDWFAQACALYPNVRRLHLKVQNNWNDLPKICSAVWETWNDSSLEELCITLHCSDYDHEWNGHFTEVMDEVITGFDRETCRKLRKLKGLENPFVEVDRESSILDMSKLKLLEFELTGKMSAGFQIFSRVSVIHAFDLMWKRQNLIVVINGTDIEDMIQERNVDFRAVVKGLMNE